MMNYISRTVRDNVEECVGVAGGHHFASEHPK